jgi:hypothetical protein
MKITQKRKKLLADIQQIRKIAFDSNYEATTVLELERERLIRMRILEDCLTIEESISILIMNSILMDSAKWKKLKYFGHIKRFNVFFTEILGYLFSFQKLAILKRLMEIPKKIEKTTRRIIALRNTFSHAATFAYSDVKKINYGDGSIFDTCIFEKYVRDSNMVIEFFLKKMRV